MKTFTFEKNNFIENDPNKKNILITLSQIETRQYTYGYVFPIVKVLQEKYNIYYFFEGGKKAIEILLVKLFQALSSDSSLSHSSSSLTIIAQSNPGPTYYPLHSLTTKQYGMWTENATCNPPRAPCNMQQHIPRAT